MASIFKKNGRGPYIIAYFDQDGHRHEKSSRTIDHATAERIANKLGADVALRREGLSTRGPTGSLGRAAGRFGHTWKT